MQYSYPKVSGGYRWNAIQRIRYEVGIEPTSMSDAEEQTMLVFDRALTTEEKEALDALMKSDPQQPPKESKTVLVIADLYEHFSEFEQIVPGLRIFYTQSDKHSNETDQIELHHSDRLTAEQIASIKEKYISLFR